MVWLGFKRIDLYNRDVHVNVNVNILKEVHVLNEEGQADTSYFVPNHAQLANVHHGK